METKRLSSVENVPEEFRSTTRKTTLRRMKGETEEQFAKRAIKNYGQTFARLGISLENIDFDEYKVEGVTLSEVPKNTIVIFILDNDLWLFDRRKGNGSLWDTLFPISTSKDTVYLDEDSGKHRKINRLPIPQILEKASAVWVIPEEDVKSGPGGIDIRSLRRERAERNPTGSRADRVRRWSRGEIGELPHRTDMAYGFSQEDFDKSGYYIDKEKWKDKFEEMVLNSPISNLAERFKPRMDRIIERYNQIAEEYLEISKKAFSLDNKLDLYAVTKPIVYTITSPENRKNLIALLNRVGSVWEKEYDFRSLESELADVKKELQKKTATEQYSIRGASGLFVDKEIISAFESEKKIK